jgi:hypothetical protein
MSSTGKSDCKRCGREFTPKTPDQEYGPTCARMLAGQTQLDSMVLISGKVLRKKRDPKCKKAVII